MTAVHVEVDIYSGRENPAWDLTEVDAAHFLTHLAALPPSPQLAASIEGLGYRGLHVTMVAGGTTRRLVLTKERAVFQVAAAADRGSFCDPNRGLEKWLIKTGREHLGDALFLHLLNEMAGKAPEN